MTNCTHWLLKESKNNIAVCCWFVVCFVVNGNVVCLLKMVFFKNQNHNNNSIYDHGENHTNTGNNNGKHGYKNDSANVGSTILDS